MMQESALLDLHFYIWLWSSSNDPSLKTSRNHKLFKGNRYNYNHNWPVTGLARQCRAPFLVEIDYHFVRERVAQRLLDVRIISTGDQVADGFTKGLTLRKMEEFRRNLNLAMPGWDWGRMLTCQDRLACQCNTISMYAVRSSWVDIVSCVCCIDIDDKR